MNMFYSSEEFEAREQEIIAQRQVTPEVAQASQKLARAQEALDEAEARRVGTPYLGSSNQPALVRWQQAVQGVATAKEAVAAATQELLNAENAAARARYTAQLQADRAAAQEKRDQAAAQQAALAENEAREEFRRAFVAAGGLDKDFTAAWPKMWAKELERRTLANQGNLLNAARTSGRYNF